MRRLLATVVLLLRVLFLAGCKISMRIAHGMVEADGIARDIKSLDRAAEERR
jgi:outer membrane lipopolysaccharide assembly protein LptE/RlpB